jgi:uncharacterized protein YybS (DUF2232 family)
MLLAVIAPLPLARERVRGGLASTALATLLALGLVGFVLDFSQSLGFLLFLALPALLVGDSVARGRGMVRGSGLALGVISLGVALLLVTNGADMLGDLLGWIDNNRSPEVLARMKSNGMPEEAIARVSEQMATLRQVVTVVFPAICFVSAALVVLANAAALRLYLARTDPGLVERGEFESLRWPVALSVPFVLAGVAVATEPLRSVGWNALVVLGALFVLEGLAVAVFFTRRLSAPPLVRGLVLALVLLNPWPLQILALAGLFDIFIDFRKWAAPPEVRDGR